MTSHMALRRDSIDYSTYNKIIIFNVSTEITNDEITQATGAIGVMRLLKKNPVGLGRSPTESVVLTFDIEPPDSIRLGYKEHPAKPFKPLPRRCFNCQTFGHGQNTCHKVMRC